MTIPLRADFHDDTFHFNAMYTADEWEPHTQEVLRRFLYPEALFVDVGAWIGPVTMWAVALGAHVIALEPDLVARDSLYLNTEGHPVTIIPKALSNHNGTTHLGNPRFYGDSQSRITTDLNDEIVECITPQVLLSDIDPALIKVDIEGHELAIIEDLAYICQKQSIPLLVAWHEPWWTRQKPLPAFWDQIFTGFTVEGAVGGWGQTLLVPT